LIVNFFIVDKVTTALIDVKSFSYPRIIIPKELVFKF